MTYLTTGLILLLLLLLRKVMRNTLHLGLGFHRANVSAVFLNSRRYCHGIEAPALASDPKQSNEASKEGSVILQVLHLITHGATTRNTRETTREGRLGGYLHTTDHP